MYGVRQYEIKITITVKFVTRVSFETVKQHASRYTVSIIIQQMHVSIIWVFVPQHVSVPFVPYLRFKTIF
jgi:hypothetical protein